MMTGISLAIGQIAPLRNGEGDAGGGGETAALAASRGEIPFNDGGVSTANVVRRTGRHRCTLGQASYSRLRVLDTNSYIDTGNGENALANDYTLRRWIEIPGAPVPVVQVTYGGANEILIASAGGAQIVESDDVAPAAFGLAEFTPGQVIWHRAERDFPQGGRALQFPPMGTAGIHADAGEGAITGPVSISRGGDEGPLDSSGSGVTSFGQMVGLPLATIGWSTAHDPAAVLCVGDSLLYGVSDDSPGDGRAGGGPWRRAFHDAGAPWVNLGKNSTTAEAFVANCTLRAQLYPYARRGLIEYGTNDFNSGATNSQVEGWNQSIATAMKAAGVPVVSVMTMLPRTNASNVASNAQFQAADADGAYVYNQRLLAGTLASWADEVIDTWSGVVAGDGETWADPADFTDGTHLTATGAQAVQGPIDSAVAGWR